MEALRSVTPITERKSHTSDLRYKGNRVRPAHLLFGLDPSEYQEILSFATVRTFVRNEMIFSQGEATKRLVLLQSGTVKVTQASLEGDEVILWINCQGETVGAAFERQDLLHTCSAQALETCKALVWQYDRFQMLGARFPQIRANVGGILMLRLQELEQRFLEVATENAERRLALALLRLVGCLGKVHQDGVTISLKGEELAQMTGSTLFTISRTLSRWEKTGMVSRRRHSIVIHDLAQLETLGSEHQKRKTRRRKDTEYRNN
jgi:CRP-like cAMP-binding protein